MWSYLRCTVGALPCRVNRIDEHLEFYTPEVGDEVSHGPKVRVAVAVPDEALVSGYVESYHKRLDEAHARRPSTNRAKLREPRRLTKMHRRRRVRHAYADLPVTADGPVLAIAALPVIARSKLFALLTCAIKRLVADDLVPAHEH